MFADRAGRGVETYPISPYSRYRSFHLGGLNSVGANVLGEMNSSYTW